MGSSAAGSNGSPALRRPRPAGAWRAAWVRLEVAVKGNVIVACNACMLRAGRRRAEAALWRAAKADGDASCVEADCAKAVSLRAAGMPPEPARRMRALPLTAASNRTRAA